MTKNEQLVQRLIKKFAVKKIYIYESNESKIYGAQNLTIFVSFFLFSVSNKLYLK